MRGPKRTSLEPTMSNHPLVPAALAALGALLPGQNLIPDPGFESGPVSCTMQGDLPAPWQQAGLMQIGADTFSTDCGTRTGLDVSWANFTNGFAAHCGMRWVAGGNNTTPVEAMGAPLAAPLAPNTTYLLAGWFRRNDRVNVQGQTGYDVGFGPAPDVAASTVAVSALGSTSGSFSWVEASAVFTTGSDTSSATHVVLAPKPGPGDISYMGVDDLVLTAVGGFYPYPQAVANDHELDATGAVAGGSTFQLAVSSAHPVQVCVLVAGTESGCAPVLGQTLTVLPIVSAWTLTDAGGSAGFPFTWPNGLPPGTRACFQTWILAAGGGFSASNGLAAVGG